MRLWMTVKSQLQRGMAGNNVCMISSTPIFPVGTMNSMYKIDKTNTLVRLIE